MIVVFGGYGTFGSQVARALAAGKAGPIVVAGRDAARARDFAAALPGSAHRGIAADVAGGAALVEALTGATVAINCAGPFSSLGTGLLDACLAAGCHYVDIADDRAYARTVRDYGARFAARALTCAYGCSSLPALSGALAISLGGAPPERARVTLFIGNANPKGAAAVRSAVGLIGRAIEAPQGPLRGFADGERVELPAPFGRRTVYNFESPEYDLFPLLLGARAVSVKVGFEMRVGTFLFATLARLGSGYGAATARLLGAAGGLLRSAGHSGGVVMTELFDAGGTRRAAAISAPTDGQRMAALPAAFVAEALRAGPAPRGAQTAYEVLGAEELLRKMVAAGYKITRS